MKWLSISYFLIMSLSIMAIGFEQPSTFVINSSADIKDSHAFTTHLKIANTLYPRLFATKDVDKWPEVIIGEKITVTITIENFGNQTAFNVTYIDQISKPWVFEVSGITKLSYSQIPPNETRQFSYIITAKSLGEHKLLGAKIEYYDSVINPTRYLYETNDVDISVVKPPEDFSLANLNTAITLLIVLIILDIFLLIRLISPKLSRRSNER